MKFSFGISGVSIIVEADERNLFNTVKAFFSAYDVTVDANAAYCIRINLHAKRKPPVKPGKRMPPLFSYGRIKGYIMKDNVLLLSDGNTTVFVDALNGVAEAYVDLPVLSRGTEFVSIFLTITLIELLRHYGLYYLHAAAVANKNHAILLCGMGMSGKTTLALGFVSKGYKLCSDDAIFLTKYDNKVFAVGFKKDIHVTDETISYYDRLLKDIKPPQPLFKKALIPYNSFPTVDSVIPDTILFVALSGTSHTTVTALNETEAMTLLIPQSLMVFFNKIYTEDHADALKMLLRRTETYRCLVGRDILKDPLIVLDNIRKIK